MSGFSAGWLALREPYDRAARNATVLDAVASAFLDQTAISVVDLACGTGSTLRAVGPHLPPRQNWLLVDNNLSLLAQVATPPGLPQLSVITRPVDLARDLELALDGPLDLVTASALLDLVSAEWLDRLIIEAAARRLPVYAALSYDGRTVTDPAAVFDAELLAGFNLHQRTDKGFGPRSGRARQHAPWSDSSTSGTQSCRDARIGCSGPDDRSIQETLFADWAGLGALTTTMSADEIAQWLAQRRACLAQGRSSLRVGHVDIFARPTGMR